ncbi:MAG: TatD family hydrolase [Treponema sp.]|nr:TatD family hydrolase [Treponema sp.]
MLAFSFADAHFHLVPCATESAAVFPESAPYMGCTCAHFEDEFFAQEQAIQTCTARNSSVHIIPACGMHPQNPSALSADFLEQLLQQRRIRAIGEAGFDFFTDAYKAQRAAQETAWDTCTALAAAYRVPLIVHCRKAMARIFADTSRLKKIPAVVFHSYGGSPAEATALLRRGVNAFFSFGKPLLAGDKSARRCVGMLPIERVLCETDAPYQTLTGERVTLICDITAVYQAVATIRKLYRAPCATVESCAAVIAQTFQTVYGQNDEQLGR